MRAPLLPPHGLPALAACPPAASPAGVAEQAAPPRAAGARALLRCRPLVPSRGAGSLKTGTRMHEAHARGG